MDHCAKHSYHRYDCHDCCRESDAAFSLSPLEVVMLSTDTFNTSVPDSTGFSGFDGGNFGGAGSDGSW